MPTMEILNQTGHTLRTWAPNDLVPDIEAEFADLIAQGYTAIPVTPDKQPQAPIRQFDPAADVVMIQPMMGG